MFRTATFIFLTLLSGAATAQTVWNGIGTHSRTNGSGDIQTSDGTAVTVSAESMEQDKFVGAITSLDATALQGREVRLTGSLLVAEGTGIAALWVRADGPNGQLAFANSGASPARAGEGAQARELQLYVPSDATHLKLGVTLDAAGRVEVQRLTLTSEPAVSGDVSAYDMMAYALPIIRANALNAGKVDWSAHKAKMDASDLKQRPAQEAYGRLQTVLNALGDRHSFLQAPRQAATARTTAVASRAIESRQMQDIGYVLVPGLRGTDAAAGKAFSAELCGKIATLAPTTSKGWIVDLRQNSGGNMWPMLSGLHPLLGDGAIGANRTRDGAVTRWGARAGTTCSLDLSRSRVAVLIGPKTTSSGEAVATAFRARPDTRFFGQTTGGRATSNRTYPLPDGGALLLTTAEFLDREGQAYPQGIRPETPVSSEQDAIEAAAAWLRSVP
ncbi:S41 family peptidase [Stenotrophomonas sp. GZD-301]|uniref:S41 family peptidase n=1 Tax=Stenotrophomonas sp. GZD-301 TaxID=3404814 RepID=UPI003BB49A2C